MQRDRYKKLLLLKIERKKEEKNILLLFTINMLICINKRKIKIGGYERDKPWSIVIKNRERKRKILLLFVDKYVG